MKSFEVSSHMTVTQTQQKCTVNGTNIGLSLLEHSCTQN